MVKIVPVPVLYCSTICLDCFRLYRTTENVLVQSYLFRPGTRLPFPSWYTVTCYVLVHGYLFRPGTRLPVPSWYTVTCSILVHGYLFRPDTGTQLPILSLYTVIGLPVQGRRSAGWSPSPSSWWRALCCSSSHSLPSLSINKYVKKACILAFNSR